MITVDSIVRVVAAGGGVSVDAKSMTADSLVRIAAASKQHNGKIVIRNTKSMTVDSMVRIAAAGKGNVIFELD